MNKDKCFEFWSRVSDRYATKGLFSDRGGYPDREAETVIITELITKKSLPYKSSYYIALLLLTRRSALGVAVPMVTKIN